MDLLDFDASRMYFDEPMDPEVAVCIARAAADYGAPGAELQLLRAYFIAPDDPSVVVALYRYYFYQHRYADARGVGERAIRLAARHLALPDEWSSWSVEAIRDASEKSMTWTRFALFAIKGAGYLSMRLGELEPAIACFSKITQVDPDDRLGVRSLLDIANRRREERYDGAEH